MSQSQTVKQQPFLFSLRQLSPDCYYIGSTHSFLPDPAPTPASLPALPTFNTDRHFFTPCFVLTLDQNYYRSNAPFELQKFTDKIEQAQLQLSNSDMNLVNPTVNFCLVCKSSYEDYQRHVAEKSHRSRMAGSLGSRCIGELCARMSRREKGAGAGGGRREKGAGKVARVKKKERCGKEETHQSGLTNHSTHIASI